MKAILILADAATAHPDGTFSLLRGGITEVNVLSNKAPVFRGALVARITGERGESGKHEFKVVCVNEDGREVISPLTGFFDVPAKGGAAQLCLSINLTLPKLGRYEFAIMIDKQQLDIWPLEAKEAPAKSSKRGGAR